MEEQTLDCVKRGTLFWDSSSGPKIDHWKWQRQIREDAIWTRERSPCRPPCRPPWNPSQADPDRKSTFFQTGWPNMSRFADGQHSIIFMLYQIGFRAPSSVPRENFLRYQTAQKIIMGRKDNATRSSWVRYITVTISTFVMGLQLRS